MANARSINSTLLNDTAKFVLEDVAAVLINNSVKITDFRTKQAADNIAYIEYEVLPSMTDLITDIKLLRADDAVLTQVVVYVPVTQAVISKHAITAKEGV